MAAPSQTNIAQSIPLQTFSASSPVNTAAVPSSNASTRSQQASSVALGPFVAPQQSAQLPSLQLHASQQGAHALPPQRATIVPATTSSYFKSIVRPTVVNAISILSFILALGLGLFTTIISFRDTKWTEHVNTVQTCISLYSIGRFSAFCNLTINGGIGPSPLAKRWTEATTKYANIEIRHMSPTTLTLAIGCPIVVLSFAVVLGLRHMQRFSAAEQIVRFDDWERPLLYSSASGMNMRDAMAALVIKANLALTHEDGDSDLIRNTHELKYAHVSDLNEALKNTRTSQSGDDTRPLSIFYDSTREERDESPGRLETLEDGAMDPSAPPLSEEERNELVFDLLCELRRSKQGIATPLLGEKMSVEKKQEVERWMAELPVGRGAVFHTDWDNFAVFKQSPSVADSDPDWTAFQRAGSEDESLKDFVMMPEERRPVAPNKTPLDPKPTLRRRVLRKWRSQDEHGPIRI